MSDYPKTAFERWVMCDRKRQFVKEKTANKWARQINGRSYLCPVCGSKGREACIKCESLAEKYRVGENYGVIGNILLQWCYDQHATTQKMESNNDTTS